MATTSSSFGEATAFKKLEKDKHKKKDPKSKEKAVKPKNNSKRKLSKENRSSELVSTKCSISCEREPEWGTEFNEELTAPVPDLYPELSDSLPNIQEIETEQGEMAKVLKPYCESEDNVQCVPTSCDDHELSDDNHNNLGTSQSQDDSQISNSHSQTQSCTKGKRKLAKPRKVRKRKSCDHGPDSGTSKGDSAKADFLQDAGKQGTWAQCSIPSCGKWRFLRNNIDPNELPERWVCSMNETNDNYNACSASQETFDSQDGNLDVVYTPYPSGAIVWAKMVGYPWWPAMMEDDPDYGYYCETDEHNSTPVMYHVVFFDKKVSRTWVNAVSIRNFAIDDDPEDMGKVTFRGKNYRRQLTAATLAARKAAQMPLQIRLAEYGFAARYKGPIGRQAVKEKERSVSLEAEEFSDSVTESSSQEMHSSGNSYSGGNSCSSPDEVKQVKPKTPSKPATSNNKHTNKGKRKEAQKKKDSDSSDKLKENGSKKKRKKSEEKFELTGYSTKEYSPERQHVDANDSGHEQVTEGQQSKDGDILVNSKELENSVSKLDSGEAINNNDTGANKPNAGQSSESNKIETKLAKKRKLSVDVQHGKKRKTSSDTKANSEKRLDSFKRKQQANVADNIATSLESSSKTQRKEKASEESKQKTIKDAKIQPNHTNSAEKDDRNTCKQSTISKCKTIVSKEKQRGKKARSSGKESACQDNPVEREPKVNLSAKDTKSRSLHSFDSELKEVNKELDSLNNQAKKVAKKRKTSLEPESEKQESGYSNGESASSFQAEDREGMSKGGVHSEQALTPHKPDFTLKRSPASTDVRVPLGENESRMKPLPKLVKAFKPPMAKAVKPGKDPKMPKLLKPHFVSPALAYPKGKHYDSKEGDEEVLQPSVARKSTQEALKQSTLKRKVSRKDQYPSDAPRKNKEEIEQSEILSEDLQAEIADIDDDIASMQKELRVSDTSDTSISEERVISPTTDQQFNPDSPEF